MGLAIGGIVVFCIWLLGKKLREKTIRLDTALSNMSQGLVMFDSAARVTVCNDRYRQIYKLPPKLVKPGCAVLDILKYCVANGTFSGNPEQYVRDLLTTIALGKIAKQDVETGDGRIISVVSQPMAGGCWVVTHEDVTEKAQADLAIRDSEKRFSDLFEFSPDGILLCDQRGTIIDVNSEATRMFGYDSCELIGQPIENLIPKDAREGHVGLRSRYLQAPARRSMGAAQVDISGLRKDGSAFPANISISPINSAGEKMVCATVRDITETKRQEASFRLLFKNNPVPMWVYDLESHCFLAVNDTAVAHYGYSREQFLAMTVLDIRPPEERERFVKFVQLNGGVHDGERIWRHQKSDKTKIDVAIYSRTLSYDGHMAALIASIDVTERKRAEDELCRTKKFLDTVIEHVPLPIMVKNVAGLETDARASRFTLFNRAYEELTGDSRIRLIGKTAHQIFPKERADLIGQADNETLQSDQVVLTREHPILTSHNGTRLVTAKKTVIMDENGKAQYLLTVVDDVTEQRRTEQCIAHMAHHDTLTDLPNRAAFNERLSFALDKAAMAHKHFAIMSIDFDRFKEINDLFGHATGDALLLEVARRLQATAEGAFLARLGGDEFSLIVADGPQPATASALAGTCQRF